MEGVEIDSSQAVEKSSQSLPGEPVSWELAPWGLRGTPTPPQTRWPESPLPGPGLSRPNIRSSSETAAGAPGPAEDPSMSEVKTPCSLPATPGWSFLPVPPTAEGCLPTLWRNYVPQGLGLFTSGAPAALADPSGSRLDMGPGPTWPPGHVRSAEGMHALGRSPARAVPTLDLAQSEPTFRAGRGLWALEAGQDPPYLRPPWTLTFLTSLTLAPCGPCPS